MKVSRASGTLWDFSTFGDFTFLFPLGGIISFQKKNTYATAINFIFRKTENVYYGNIGSVSWRILMLGLTMFDNVTESRCISYFPFNSASTQHGLSGFFSFHEWNTTDTL